MTIVWLGLALAAMAILATGFVLDLFKTITH